MRVKTYYTHFWCNILPFILHIYQTFHSFYLSVRDNKNFNRFRSEATKYVGYSIGYQFVNVAYLLYIWLNLTGEKSFN